MLTPETVTFLVKMPTNFDLAGSWLKHERELAGVSQDKAATKAGIHKVQLSRIENGHSGVKRDTLVDLISAVNKLSLTGHKIKEDEALNRFGYASADIQQKPRTIADLLDRLKEWGIEIEDIPVMGYDVNSPEDYDRMTEDLAIALEATLLRGGRRSRFYELEIQPDDEQGRESGNEQAEGKHLSGTPGELPRRRAG